VLGMWPNINYVQCLYEPFDRDLIASWSVWLETYAMYRCLRKRGSFGGRECLVCDSGNGFAKISRNCPNCKRPQRAAKQLRIARLPTILIIVLKRFHYEGPWRDKLNTFVDFPMRNLDLTKYALQAHSSQPEKSENYLYDLYAVTNHFGTLSGGHCMLLHCYIDIDTACIHNKLRGKWFVFDDSRVSPCEDTSVVVRTAHLKCLQF